MTRTQPSYRLHQTWIAYGLGFGTLIAVYLRAPICGLLLAVTLCGVGFVIKWFDPD